MNAFKSFKDFKEGILELSSISTTIKNIVDEHNTIADEANPYEAVINKILDYVSESIPCIDSEQYPNTIAISISANEVGVKCPGQIAFGWRCRLDKDNKVCYDFRITINSSYRFAKNNIVLKEAEKLGWRLADSKRKNFDTYF